VIGRFFRFASISPSQCWIGGLQTFSMTVRNGYVVSRHLMLIRRWDSCRQSAVILPLVLFLFFCVLLLFSLSFAFLRVSLLSSPHTRTKEMARPRVISNRIPARNRHPNALALGSLILILKFRSRSWHQGHLQPLLGPGRCDRAPLFRAKLRLRTDWSAVVV
jgi:hypothetical protein